MRRKSMLKKAFCLAAALVLAASPAAGGTAYAAGYESGGSYDAPGSWSGPGADGSGWDDSDGGGSGWDDADDGGSGWDDPDDDDYEAPALNTASVNLIAGGDAFALKLEHAASAEYTVAAEDAAVIALSDMTAESVTITPLAAGDAEVSVTAVGMDQTVTALVCRVRVSALSLSKQSVEIYLNDADRSAKAAVQGADLDAVYYGTGSSWEESLREEMSYYSSQCSITSTNPSVAGAYFSDGRILITGYAKGTAKIKVNIHGKTLSVKVKVYHSTLNKYVINTYKGSAKKTLKVRGAGSRKASWQSSNKKTAVVSAKGVVTIKGVGTAEITAKIGKSRLVCVVSASTKAAYQAVKQARSLSKNKDVHYSQPLRMSTNYYDCSSLVWRCYKPYGITFGSAYYAPVASEEGRWCAENRCVIAKKAVDITSLKLVAGDTIYYSYNESNGQYLNIDHAAIFGGYAYDEWGGIYGTVLEASSSNNAVVERRYYGSESIKLIGRPSR